ncbi:MAG: glutamate 5-kinase [Nitrospirae bacterium]|nr:glutamate 5-kinase [Nitrospirota bacterium]
MTIFVIKIGSSIITDDFGLSEKRIESIVNNISEIHDKGIDPVIVSSGAVAAGKNKLNIKGKITDINLKQAAAAIGQSSLIWAYERAFNKHGKKAAQVLLTQEIFSDRNRYINAKNTLSTLISYRVVPIINENDTVAIEGLKFGDNDRLAALVSTLLNADKLIILSDVDGLYTENPQSKSAKLIPIIKEITTEIEQCAGVTQSLVGTGGMCSKVQAAKIATDNSIPTYIINGNNSGQILDILEDIEVGTKFEPQTKRYGARKGWIASGIKSNGSLILDDGAVNAIISKGTSLLPSGINKIEGQFVRGDAVYCIDKNGNKIAKGLVNYSSEELIKIYGKKTSHIETILGFKYSDEVIHRDNMTIIKG